MTVEDAVHDLLSMSADISGVAVLDAAGRVLTAAPAAAADDLAAGAARLWAAACSSAAARQAAVSDVIVHDRRGVVAMLEASGHRIVAVTGPRPAAGLLLFDLRMCLADAFGGGEAS